MVLCLSSGERSYECWYWILVRLGIAVSSGLWDSVVSGVEDSVVGGVEDSTSVDTGNTWCIVSQELIGGEGGIRTLGTLRLYRF